jgi:RNA polymerase sigma-70 factor (ECF subfamily)
MSQELAVPSSLSLGAVDEEQVQRLRAGDPALVAELYDRHHDTVRTFARRLLGDAQAAEDLVHDVFLTVPSAMQRYRGGAFRSFLMAIAVNLARKHVRTAIGRRKTAQRAGAEAELQTAFACPVERAQLADQLHRALDTLSAEQRTAFVLCVVEERSSAEAAIIAGVPEATIRTRVHHARRRLQEILRRRGVR